MYSFKYIHIFESNHNLHINFSATVFKFYRFTTFFVFHSMFLKLLVTYWTLNFSHILKFLMNFIAAIHYSYNII